MKSKRILSIILVFVMIFAMAATACGKKEEAAEKEEPKQEEKVEATKSEETDEAEKAEVSDDTEEAADQVDTTKEKLTEGDIEALKASIAEAVTNEYLEPNNVAVEDFSWPASDSFAWNYLKNIIKIYWIEHFTEEDGPSNLSPSSQDEEIVEAVLSGITNWYETSGVENHQYFENAVYVLQPYEEVIPTIDLASK